MLDDLKREIELLDDLRIGLQFTENHPDIGGKLDIILSDMQRANERIAKLLNPDEGGMLVSEKGAIVDKGKEPIKTIFTTGSATVTIIDDRGFQGSIEVLIKDNVDLKVNQEPKVGDWGYFWDEEIYLCVFGKLVEIRDTDYRYRAEYSQIGGDPRYKHFSHDIPTHIKELMNGSNTTNS